MNSDQVLHIVVIAGTFSDHPQIMAAANIQWTSLTRLAQHLMDYMVEEDHETFLEIITR